MRPVAVLTFILSVLCLFIMNVVFAADLDTLNRDSFINGSKGDNEYTYEDKAFDSLENEAYLVNVDDKNEREAAGNSAETLKRSREESRVLKKSPKNMRPRAEDLEPEDDADPLG